MWTFHSLGNAFSVFHTNRTHVYIERKFNSIEEKQDYSKMQVPIIAATRREHGIVERVARLATSRSSFI